MAQNEEVEPLSERVQEEIAEEEMLSQQVDQLKLIAVVDSSRSLSRDECVYINMKKSDITHLSVNTQTSMHFDELITSYDQVQRIGRGLAHRFVSRQNTNKVVLNIADQFATNNNCGFNLANFKPKFIKDYFNEVVSDYERSFIGAFATSVIEDFLPDSGCELYFTVAKFEGNMGYSLTQNYDEVQVEVDEENKLNLKAVEKPNEGDRTVLNETTSQDETATLLRPIGE